MATRGRPQDLRSWMDEKFREVWDRIKELERPDGSQLFNALAKVQELIADLPAQVAAAATAFLSSGFTTGSMTASGNVTAAGTVTATTGFTSTGAYNNNITGVGSYRAMWIGVNGSIGYVPSSLRFKQDVAAMPIDEQAVLALQLVSFRYTAAIENLGDDAPTEVGLIAEQVHELGMTWLVDYDDEGKPFGIKYERLAFALLPVIQSFDQRLRAAGL